MMILLLKGDEGKKKWNKFCLKEAIRLADEDINLQTKETKIVYPLTIRYQQIESILLFNIYFNDEFTFINY